MFGLFGKKSLDESLREHKASLRKSVREIEREKLNLERQQKDLTKNIKNEANQGHMNSVKILARSLVKNREQIEQFAIMKSHLQAIDMRLQSAKSTKAMNDSIKNVSQVLKELNASMNGSYLNKNMTNFTLQNEKMKFTDELLSENLKDTLFSEDSEVQEDQIIQQVLEEIGVDMNTMLSNSSTYGLPQLNNPKDSTTISSFEKELEDRLKNLNS